MTGSGREGDGIHLHPVDRHWKDSAEGSLHYTFACIVEHQSSPSRGERRKTRRKMRGSSSIAFVSTPHAREKSHTHTHLEILCHSRSSSS